jgi:c-di-GMP-binding flagellar brake protein YcgR
MDTLNPLERETRTSYGILNFERRKYRRFSVDFPVEYYRVDKPAGFCDRSLDINRGGLLVYFSERMEIGQHLRLRLFFSIGSELNTIEFLSEVAWVDMHIGEGWGHYRVGVNFVDISPDDMTKLESFLISLSQPR